MTETREPRLLLYLGFALLTCSMLLVQQYLTRIFSIQFNAGLAFLAISTTFLGLGSAGVAVCVFPRWFAAEKAERQIPRLALAYALLLVGGFCLEVVGDSALQARYAATGEPLSAQIVRVMVGSLFLLPPLFCVGLVISLVLRAHSDRVGKLYGADLAGGGVGCLLVLALMEWVGGDDGIFAIGGLAALGASLLGVAHRRWAAAVSGLVLAVGVVLLGLANGDRSLVDVRSHRTVMYGAGKLVKEEVELDRTWNALSRLGFYPTHSGSDIYVRIDSSCQTSLPSQDRARIEGYVRATDFERLPFVLDRHDKYFEIGAGGGRGMLLAHEMGSEEITGVEINPGIVEATMGKFQGYGIANLVEDPDVELRVGEGRSAIRGVDDRFDALTITFIQTGVASGSAAFALSEANLFTVEAFEDFIGKLTDDGVFYVYRHGGTECLRLISMLREVFDRLDLGDLRDHLYIVRTSGNACMVLVGRSPLEAPEVAALDAAVAELGLEELYAPGENRDPRPANPFLGELAAARAAGGLTMGKVVELFDHYAHHPDFEPIEGTYARAEDPAAFVEQCIVDVSAPTDDKPYFFFTGLRHVSDFWLYFDPDGVNILGGTVVMLFWMAIGFAVLVAVLIVLPLGLRRRGSGVRGGFWVLMFFSGLGVGYIAVQISFIQRFALFLGHPVYALSVVLLGFLVSSGLGSVLSRRWFDSGVLTLPRLVALLVAVLLLGNWLLPVLFHSDAITWPVIAKIAVSLAAIFVFAFPMGMFFPYGIGLVERISPDLVPWAWGANSAASVIGSILALTLAIHAGFGVVAVAAAAVYVLATLPAGAMLRRLGSPG